MNSVAAYPYPSTDNRQVWYSRCPVPTPFAIALRQGWLRQAVQALGDQHALAWRSLAESQDTRIRNAHFTHAHADIFRHGGNVPPIWARANGADTVVLGISWVTMRQQVQVMPESGIRTPADLRGKRLLLQRSNGDVVDYWRASTLRTYEAALRCAGLTLDDVQWVEQPSQVGAGHGNNDSLSRDGSLWTADRSLLRRRELLLPLVRGEVDAIATQAHYGVELEGLIGARTIFDRSLATDPLERVNNDTPDILTVSRRLLHEKPHVVQAVLRQLLRARDWALAHRAQALQLFAQEFRTSEALVESSWGDDLLSGLDISITAEKVAALQAQHDFLLSHGFIQQPFDVLAWVDSGPLQLAEHAYRHLQSSIASAASVLSA